MSDEVSEAWLVRSWRLKQYIHFNHFRLAQGMEPKVLRVHEKTRAEETADSSAHDFIWGRS